ncbi:cell division protein FtsZ [Ahrensia kielensis]|uniref:Cell division protein FtsZ n=1 Tax=Ahrensia kielensis TaxID=76980 RepID=A0ABU9T4F0_9HYPH
MTINLQKPDITELKPRITVFGVGGGGGNAVNNMITGGLDGVEFVVANTDAQALSMNKAERIIQLGTVVTEGLGAGSMPDIGRAAAEECIDEINDHLNGTHMCFVTAGMGGGTGTGAAPVVARAARERGILTVGVVTKPFHFEGQRRMKTADAGIEELQANVDTLIVIPNQNLFRIANDKTTFADAFGMADQVLYSGVACITDLMVKEGLINLDFADVRSVMRDMGKAMMGTGEASGEGRAMTAAEAAIANPLLDETSMKGARGLLISITGGRDMTLFEVDEAATRIREEVDQDANIILGATFDESLEGIIRVSVVATGIESMEASGSVDNRTPSRAVTGAAPVQSMPRPQLSVQPQAKPVEATKPAPVKPALDPVAEAQKEMEALSNARKVEETKQEESFVPQSRLFTAPTPQAKPAPSVAPSQPVREPVAEVKPQPTVVPMPTAAQPAASTPSAEPRMPQVEDFPPMVQAELETKTARTAPRVAEDDDRGPLGLLKRLTNGLSRREEHEAPAEPRLRPMNPASEQRSEDTRRPLSQEASMYAPARSQHDNQGRTQPTAVNQDDDQLEIPAFLRRQAN